MKRTILINVLFITTLQNKRTYLDKLREFRRKKAVNYRKKTKKH
jgi:hypothetical protein